MYVATATQLCVKTIMNLEVPEATKIKTAILVHQSLNLRTIFSEIKYVNFIKDVGNGKLFLKGYSPHSYYSLNHHDNIHLVFICVFHKS